MKKYNLLSLIRSSTYKISIDFVIFMYLDSVTFLNHWNGIRYELIKEHSENNLKFFKKRGIKYQFYAFNRL